MEIKPHLQFCKDYHFDDLSDLNRDIHESFDERFNPDTAKPIQDSNGVFNGRYRVTIEYFEDNSN